MSSDEMVADATAAAGGAAARTVSFAEAAKVWTKIGWLSFGGPAGQIALMLRFKIGMGWTLAGSTLLGAVYWRVRYAP